MTPREKDLYATIRMMEHDVRLKRFMRNELGNILGHYPASTEVPLSSINPKHSYISKMDISLVYSERGFECNTAFRLSDAVYPVENILRLHESGSRYLVRIDNPKGVLYMADVFPALTSEIILANVWKVLKCNVTENRVANRIAKHALNTQKDIENMAKYLSSVNKLVEKYRR
jgi:hypothetical protein